MRRRRFQDNLDKMKSNFAISLFAVREGLRMMVNKMLIVIESEDLSQDSPQKSL
jgi:hypothetical protein